MADEIIDSLELLISKACEQNVKGELLFRGVSCFDYQLVPKIGRNEKYVARERELLEEFVMCGVPYSNYLAMQDASNNDEFDFRAIALAQHHGLPTRLLDWTTNPLVALFFACNGNDTVNGKVCITRSDQFNNQVEDSPLDAQQVFVYRPSRVTPRIAAQEGLFTVHPTQFLASDLMELANENGDLYEFDALLVPASMKSALLSSLDKIGVNTEALFPDLDGLARYLEWKYDCADVMVDGRKPYA